MRALLVVLDVFVSEGVHHFDDCGVNGFLFVYFHILL